jgi:hypothetical protein
VCRPSTGACDVAESCDGVSNSCPPEAKEPDGTRARSTRVRTARSARAGPAPAAPRSPVPPARPAIPARARAWWGRGRAARCR